MHHCGSAGGIADVTGKRFIEGRLGTVNVRGPIAQATEIMSEPGGPSHHRKQQVGRRVIAVTNRCAAKLANGHLPPGQILASNRRVPEQVMLVIPNGTVQPFTPGVDSGQNGAHQKNFERAAKRPALIRVVIDSPAISGIQGSNTQADAPPGFHCLQAA